VADAGGADSSRWGQIGPGAKASDLPRSFKAGETNKQGRGVQYATAIFLGKIRRPRQGPTGLKKFGGVRRTPRSSSLPNWGLGEVHPKRSSSRGGPAHEVTPITADFASGEICSNSKAGVAAQGAGRKLIGTRKGGSRPAVQKPRIRGDGPR